MKVYRPKCILRTVFAIYYNSADGTEQEDPKECKTGPAETQPKPSADLVLISDSTDDNGFLTNARNAYGNEVAIGSVSDVIDAIESYGGSTLFTVLVIDHGRKAYQSMGDGQGRVAGQYIDNTNATKADRDAFTAACSASDVSKVTFCGCCVALDTEGAQFLQDLADAGDMTMRAFTLKTLYRKNGTFAVTKAGTWVEKSP